MVRCTLFVDRMHNFRRSDAQLQQCGCTTIVGRMHNYSRSDAQLQQVGCTTIVGRIHNYKQVGCTTIVGRMNNYSRSDSQLQQVGCTTIVGQIHNYRRQDAQLFTFTKGVSQAATSQLYPDHSARTSLFKPQCLVNLAACGSSECLTLLLGKYLKPFYGIIQFKKNRMSDSLNLSNQE